MHMLCVRARFFLTLMGKYRARTCVTYMRALNASRYAQKLPPLCQVHA